MSTVIYVCVCVCVCVCVVALQSWVGQTGDSTAPHLIPKEVCTYLLSVEGL